MSEPSGTHNDTSGEVHGPLVQAGSIGHLSLNAAEGPLPVPRQLPWVAPDFTGRTEQLAALDALLPSASDPSVIAAVDGPAGVGKTALALRWAHRVQDRFPDGTLYADLRGYGPGKPASPTQVLGEFLGGLGLLPSRIPPGLTARAGQYRTLLADRRVLIVLDNADTADQVRPLLPGGSGCVVLVTSRAGLGGLVAGEGAVRIRLGLLTEPEAVALVWAMLGHRAEAEPRAVLALIAQCARLPLALRVAAGLATTRPYRTLAELVAELGSDPDRLDALSVPADARTAVRTVFGWSYHRLTDDQARVFRRLGLHPGPEISLHAAAVLAGLDLPTAQRLLDVLAEGHLVEPMRRDRYRLHDLLRAYAAERADLDDSPADRDQARRDLLGWYAHHGELAFRAVSPDMADWHAVAGAETGVGPEITFAGAEQAWAWAEDELVNTVPGVRAAAEHGLSGIVVRLATTSVPALLLRGRWEDGIEVCRLGLAAASELGDRTAEWHLLQHLGQTHRGLVQWVEAAEVFQAALTLAEELGDPVLLAMALCHLGSVCVEQGRYLQAREHLRAALPLSSGALRGHLESFIEYHLSAVHHGLGEYDQARAHAERSLSLLPADGNREAEAYLMHALARARQGAGEHREAAKLCKRALVVEPCLGDPRYHAAILDTLGESLRHLGEAVVALECWRSALAIFEEFGDQRAHALKQRLRELEALAGQ
ncbi:ATP-binding protein [Crossiella cryophila]|uniref:Tetratricopeptide (TPR) repeat protein n=1 Tax=Crossiella cryophila TaxID=43355 RepID=A0A7W7CIA5_9PSEU|nr:tetratricopeptide repeat protein [Crossiella cryophila]MBB4679999.1 tetratricopeptide (TPR) repeat protein [Crossiella cryophila]